MLPIAFFASLRATRTRKNEVSSRYALRLWYNTRKKRRDANKYNLTVLQSKNVFED